MIVKSKKEIIMTGLAEQVFFTGRSFQISYFIFLPGVGGEVVFKKAALKFWKRLLSLRAWVFA